MPFRDSTLAIEHRLRLLREERRSIDASIDEAMRMLRELRRPARRRRRHRILVLVTLPLAVIVPISVVVGRAWWSARHSPEETARWDADWIAHDAAHYAAEHPGAGCPTTGSLTTTGFEHDVHSSTEDPWDNDFRIDCAGDEITVRSAGPDQEFGTEDDIPSAPK